MLKQNNYIRHIIDTNIYKGKRKYLQKNKNQSED